MIALLAQVTPQPISAAAEETLTFPSIDWPALVPMIALAVGAVLLLTLTSVLRRPTAPSWLPPLWTIVTASVSMLAVLPLWARVQGWDQLLWWDLDTATRGPFSTVGVACQGVTGPSCGSIGIDGFSLAITLVIGAAVILTTLLAHGYLEREAMPSPEFHALLLLSAAGGVVLASANDLIVLFLGLETLSIAVYVLAAMHLRRAQSQEAGMKYFALGAFASAFLLYGIAMVYGATGTTNLVAIKTALADTVQAPVVAQLGENITLNSPLLLLGLGLMLVGLGFKVAAVPFHFWTPDVYDGAPSPTVAFMGSAVKAAGFAALLRVYLLAFSTYAEDWRPVLVVLAALSMVVGALLAIVQTNVKRILAYSSISHAGFLLMALQSDSALAPEAVAFYLISYLFLVAGSFGVVTLVARSGDQRTTLDDYQGLAHTSPVLAFVLTVLLLGQAGIPFTSGFVAKLYAFEAAVEGGTWYLALIGALASVVAAYLYLRIIVQMYMRHAADPATEHTRAARVRTPAPAVVALLICVGATLFFGLWPDPLTRFSRDAAPAIVEVAPEAPATGSPVELPQALRAGGGSVPVPSDAGAP